MSGERHFHGFTKSQMIAITLIALQVSACNIGDAGEVSGETEERVGAFSEPRCLTADPDFTNVDASGKSFAFVDESPDTYNNRKCGNARVYRLVDPYSPTTHLAQPFQQLMAGYKGEVPSTQTACENSLVGVQVYTDMGTSNAGATTPQWTMLDTATAEGTWTNGSCRIPMVTVAIPAHKINSANPPWTYQVDATARTDANRPTKVVLQSGPCGGRQQTACLNNSCQAGLTHIPATFGDMCVPTATRTIPCDLTGLTVHSTTTLSISNAGTWKYTGHAHDSGVFVTDNFSTAVGSPSGYGGKMLSIGYSDVVQGDGVIGGHNDKDWSLQGFEPELNRSWSAIVDDFNAGKNWHCHMHVSTDPWLTGLSALQNILAPAAVIAGAVVFAMGSSNGCTSGWGSNPDDPDRNVTYHVDCP